MGEGGAGARVSENANPKLLWQSTAVARVPTCGNCNACKHSAASPLDTPRHSGPVRRLARQGGWEGRGAIANQLVIAAPTHIRHARPTASDQNLHQVYGRHYQRAEAFTSSWWSRGGGAQHGVVVSNSCQVCAGM